MGALTSRAAHPSEKMVVRAGPAGGSLDGTWVLTSSSAPVADRPICKPIRRATATYGSRAWK
jgi:hypothetical protein